MRSPGCGRVEMVRPPGIAAEQLARHSFISRAALLVKVTRGDMVRLDAGDFDQRAIFAG